MKTVTLNEALLLQGYLQIMQPGSFLSAVADHLVDEKSTKLFIEKTTAAMVRLPSGSFWNGVY